MDLDTLLRETAPVPDPSPATLAKGRAVLDARTSATVREVTAVRRSRLRRSRAGRLGLITLAAAAVSAVLVVGPTLDLGGDREPPATAGAAVLTRAAVAAGSQPGGWPDAAFWHAVSTYQQGDGPVVRREIWLGHREPGVLKDPGVLEGVIKLDVATFAAGSRGLTWDQLYSLPTEPAALERELRDGIDGAGPDDDTEMFVIVGDLLRASPAPPALRKALWEVAAGIPGVVLVGPATDSAGRPGVAVERGSDRYLLDPDDGRLLEEVSFGGPEGSQDSYRSTYLEQGPSESAPRPTR